MILCHYCETFYETNIINLNLLSHSLVDMFKKKKKKKRSLHMNISLIVELKISTVSLKRARERDGVVMVRHFM
jgi:hypothetical protein